MVLFSGKAPGLEDFHGIDATDGFDLCFKLFPDCHHEDNIPKRFRMWLEVPDAMNEKFWSDVGLRAGRNSAMYEASLKEALKISDTTVNVIIRGANDSSPNSRKFLPSSPSGLEIALSNLTATTAEMMISPVAPSNIVEIQGALNTKEPFTCIDISEATAENSELNLIPLFFQQVQKERVVQNHSLLLVDLESLEKFVETQTLMGKSPLAICLNNVQCREGRTNNFALTMDVWIESMLSRSAFFRSIFTQAGYAETYRTEQLHILKTQAPSLFDRLCFWVDDMLDFEEAQWRLDEHFEATSICKVMSPYYFTEPEARY